MKKANAALEVVRVEIQRIESKKAELQEKANGTGVSVASVMTYWQVKAMQAKNELQQLLTQDPTELNKVENSKNIL